MESRQRSPSYPSTPLGEAIDLTRKIHNVERSNPVDRAVAAKAMGYSGISGRSATVLSNLIQFGLLEKTGKNEVRVTRRAVEILYPDTDGSKAAAVRAAAKQPELFQAISERFNDGSPSQAALEAYLIRTGFTHTAIGPAARAYLETFLFLENEIESESHPERTDNVIVSQSNQLVERSPPMNSNVNTPAHVPIPAVPAGKEPDMKEGFGVHFSQKVILLSGCVRTLAEADELISILMALKAMLPNPAPAPEPVSDA